MDRLDTILLEAWNRVGARVRRKRISALKRSRRRFKGVLRRPMREWCLVIRASDTRIARLADWVEERQEEVATEGCTSGAQARRLCHRRLCHRLAVIRFGEGGRI